MKYTFFFVLNDSLGYEDSDMLEVAIRGDGGHKILDEKCKDREDLELPDNLDISYVNNICYSMLINRVFANRLDLYSDYYQAWIWDHQQQKFI